MIVKRGYRKRGRGPVIPLPSRASDGLSIRAVPSLPYKMAIGICNDVPAKRLWHASPVVLLRFCFKIYVPLAKMH
jgi:hypothetical protein